MRLHASSAFQGAPWSAWQTARVIGFRRLGRTTLFSVADIQTAIDRHRIAPIGELKPRRQSVATVTITAQVPATGSEPPTREHRLQHIATEPATTPTASA
jgi:hypothetical protein